MRVSPADAFATLQPHQVVTIDGLPVAQRPLIAYYALYKPRCVQCGILLPPRDKTRPYVILDPCFGFLGYFFFGKSPHKSINFKTATYKLALLDVRHKLPFFLALMALAVQCQAV